MDGGTGMGKPESEEKPRVTRSIMIKRPAGCPSPASGNSPRGNATPPQSPAGSTPPLSPLFGGECSISLLLFFVFVSFF
jgi:hypothetical protein